MKRWLIAAVVAVLCGSTVQAADRVPVVPPLRTFSSIAWSPEAHEWFGLEITFVPHTGGTYVLWRVAGGRIEAPLLLQAILDGRFWTVEMPSNDIDTPGGAWRIEERAREAIAKSPTGGAFRMRGK